MSFNAVSEETPIFLDMLSVFFPNRVIPNF